MTIRSTTPALFFALGAFTVHAPAADIRAWSFGATVISVDDPDMELGDVRLGDPITGSFAYDVALPADSSSNSPQWADYTHPGWFQGVRLVLENPRTGEELRYGSQPEDFGDFFMAAFTEEPFTGLAALRFWEFVEPPRPEISSGFIWIDFSGPDVLTDVDLPTEINLDDWEFAEIYLGVTKAVAAIHTVTPIATGDIDLNGVVDRDDYLTWRNAFGESGVPDNDASRNGWVDAADYTMWRDNVDAATAMTTNVPEPAAIVILIGAMTVLPFVRRQKSSTIASTATMNGGRWRTISFRRRGNSNHYSTCQATWRRITSPNCIQWKPEKGSMMTPGFSFPCTILRTTLAYCLCITVSTTSVTAAEFIPLGFLGDSDAPNARVHDISADGLVITGRSTGDGDDPEGHYRWTRESGMVDIDGEDNSGDGTILSDDGSTVTWVHTPGQDTQRVWSEDFGLVSLPRFTSQSRAGMSADGSVIVGGLRNTSNRNVPVKWSFDTGFEELAMLSGFTTGTAMHVSPDASVIVGLVGDGSGFCPVSGCVPFRWTGEEGMTLLGTVPGDNSYGLSGMSADGSVVVGSSRNFIDGTGVDALPFSLWRWTAETGMTVLAEGTSETQYPPEDQSPALSVSHDGDVIAGSRVQGVFADPFKSEVYRWTESTGVQMVPHAPGYTQSSFVSMSADGSLIRGFSQNPEDLSNAFFSNWLWSEQMGQRLLLDVLVDQGLSADIAGWGRIRGVLSEDGLAIAGNTTNPDGFQEGFVVYLDPLVPNDLPGDLNGDGLVNFDDLSPFVMALTDPAGYEATFPDLNRIALCDTSGDGSCNFLDLSPFARLLTDPPGGGVVPEPATFALWVFAVCGLMFGRGRRGRSVVTCCLCIAVAIGSATAAEFIPLGFLGEAEDGSKESRTWGISRDGLAATGTSTSREGRVVYKWTRADGMTALHQATESSDLRVAISDDSSTVVWLDGDTNPNTTNVWSENFELQTLPEFTNRDAKVGMSADGSVIVGSTNGGRPGMPVKWSFETGFEELDLAPGFTIGEADYASSDGSVIFGRVGTDRSTGSCVSDCVPFRWAAEEGMTILGSVPGDNNFHLSGISADGSVVFGSSNNFIDGTGVDGTPYSLWRWTAEAGLTVLAEGTSDAEYSPFGNSAVSREGDVFAGRRSGGLADEVYRWTEADGFRTLPHALGYTGSGILDMTADGSLILGFSSDPVNPNDTPNVLWFWNEQIGQLQYLDVLADQGFSADIAGWNLVSTIYMSADGLAIAGRQGTNPDGDREAWVAYLDPFIPIDLPGDLNGDGLVNFDDLSPFVTALTDPAGYEVTYPELDRVALCDTSGDDACNFLDLSPFARLLTDGQGASDTNAVPEPSSGLLLTLAAVLTGLIGRSRSRNHSQKYWKNEDVSSI